jgi:hypothetical protein
MGSRTGEPDHARSVGKSRIVLSGVGGGRRRGGGGVSFALGRSPIASRQRGTARARRVTPRSTVRAMPAPEASARAEGGEPEPEGGAWWGANQRRGESHLFLAVGAWSVGGGGGGGGGGASERPPPAPPSPAPSPKATVVGVRGGERR